MTPNPDTAPAKLLRRLSDAGSTGVPVDSLAPTELAALKALSRSGQATIAFGRAHGVVTR